MNRLQKFGESILHWNWTKALLYWLIISAGTMSECVFLLASLWMCLNASVHTLMLAVMQEIVTIRLTELSTAAYVGLPECILPLAVVTTYRHVRLFAYDKRAVSSIVWSILYGLPTVVFLTLSMFTLGNSVLSLHFQLPAWMIVIRALAGFQFAFTSLIYWQLGNEQETDRLQEKDKAFDDLRQRMEDDNKTHIAKMEQVKQDLEKVISAKEQELNRLQSHFTDVIERLNTENSSVKNLLSTQQNTISHLAEKASSLERGPIETRFPLVYTDWIEQSVKSVSLEDIVRVTGFSKRKIQSVSIRKAGRNGELYLVSSVIEWLKTLSVTDNRPLLNGHSNHSETDTEALKLPVMTLVTEE